MDGTAFIFGDELGVPMTLAALPRSATPVVVVDPQQNRRIHIPDKVSTIPFPDKKGRAAFLKTVAGYKPGLGIINSFSRILWPDLLDMFTLGVVNLHLSKLPEYRGANTLQWTLINGESETAATLHVVDAGVDTGPIVDQQAVTIDAGDTALTLQRKLLKTGSALLDRWLPELLQHPAQGTGQDESRARAWPRRTPEDGQIDWAWPDEKIRNLTRALVSPWPGAWYADHNGNRVVIDRALTMKEVHNLRKELGL